MRVVSALVIGAAVYLQLGDFTAVEAATCADPTFMCIGDTVRKDPLPQGDCNVDTSVSCTADDCCGELAFLAFRRVCGRASRDAHAIHT